VQVRHFYQVKQVFAWNFTGKLPINGFNFYWSNNPVDGNWYGHNDQPGRVCRGALAIDRHKAQLKPTFSGDSTGTHSQKHKRHYTTRVVTTRQYFAQPKACDKQIKIKRIF